MAFGYGILSQLYKLQDSVFNPKLPYHFVDEKLQSREAK